MLNNLDWFGGMGLLTFLREIGEQGALALPALHGIDYAVAPAAHSKFSP